MVWSILFLWFKYKCRQRIFLKRLCMFDLCRHTKLSCCFCFCHHSSPFLRPRHHLVSNFLLFISYRWSMLFLACSINQRNLCVSHHGLGYYWFRRFTRKIKSSGYTSFWTGLFSKFSLAHALASQLKAKNTHTWGSPISDRTKNRSDKKAF